ncbi:metallophosphoesterase [Falsiroseomonas sp. CW058]|uniref:metallophosphoesterase n=1 Tax=Falsiroseomonas sp. CW058 TaxID=3388664 RepID=UPI003D317CC3
MLAESLGPGWLPDGVRIYAVGDSHGCAERLEELHARIADDMEDRPVDQALLVHLGDYVDRGPDSAGVLARLRDSPVPGVATINLVGNHEQMMLAALAPRASQEVVGFWLDNGGGATLESYGADPRDRRGWAAAVPAGDLALLRALRPSFGMGGYFFAHAGVRPDVPLDRQDVMDLAWIREPFLSWRGRLPAVVVHGHTPAEGPEVLPHRIGIDTGAVFGGALTCAVLEGEMLGFLFA